MSDYITLGGDSLPSIAEQFGHAGEWQALAEANADHIWGDYNNLQPGLTIAIPPEWAVETEPAMEPAMEAPQPRAADLSGMTAAQLANLAYGATTLAELDAIDAAAAGRVTVESAVATRRNELLDQGATA
jgi:hypothetical protein